MCLSVNTLWISLKKLWTDFNLPRQPSRQHTPWHEVDMTCRITACESASIWFRLRKANLLKSLCQMSCTFVVKCTSLSTFACLIWWYLTLQLWSPYFDFAMSPLLTCCWETWRLRGSVEYGLVSPRFNLHLSLFALNPFWLIRLNNWVAHTWICCVCSLGIYEV